ncbi:MAG: rod-binding protein [Acetobacteraceae bacterium]|nr:rod-binding protein [Acetobacteraceae bacterium]
MTEGISATTPAATVPAGKTLSPEQIAKTRKAAQDFEAMALGEMLKPMFATVDTSKGLFGGGAGEATWKPLMVDEMAKSIAKSGGLGIADAVLKEMLRLQEAKDD